MSDQPERPPRPRSSRQRYRGFVEDYKQRRLDAIVEADQAKPGGDDKPAADSGRGKRRQYLREYLRWLRPHRYSLIAVFLFALLVAGLQMIEPLFMRYIIDRVLLNSGLDKVARLSKLHLAGIAFVTVVVLSNLLGVLKDYRQRLLNTRVMLSLRHSLFDRLLHLPLPRLWD